MRVSSSAAALAVAALVSTSASAATIALNGASFGVLLDLPGGVFADGALTPVRMIESADPTAVFEQDVAGDAFSATSSSRLEVTGGQARVLGGFTSRIDLRNEGAEAAEVLVSNDFGFTASALAEDMPSSVPLALRNLAEISLAFVPYVGADESRFVFDLGLGGDDGLAFTTFMDSFSQAVIVPAGGATTLTASFSFSSNVREVSSPTPAPIPLPAGGALLLLGLGGLAGLRRARA